MIGTPHVLHAVASGAIPTLTYTYAMTLSSGAAAGERAWLFLAAECGDTAPAVPTLNITDSKGNTWTVHRPLLRNGGGTGGTVAVLGASALLTTALVSGDTVTMTNPNSDWQGVRYAACIVAASGVDGIDQSATADPGSTSALSIGPVTTTTAQEIIWAQWGHGVRAFTPGTNFTEVAELATAVGTADRQLSVEYRIVNATGSYSATGTLASSTTVVGSMSTWKATADPRTHYVMVGGVWQPAEVTLL